MRNNRIYIVRTYIRRINIAHIFACNFIELHFIISRKRKGEHDNIVRTLKKKILLELPASIKILLFTIQVQ